MTTYDLVYDLIKKEAFGDTRTQWLLASIYRCVPSIIFLDIQPRVKSLESSYTGLYPQKLQPLEGRCRANMAHVRQSRPYPSPDVQAKAYVVPSTLTQVVPSSLQFGPSSLGNKPGRRVSWRPCIHASPRSTSAAGNIPPAYVAFGVSGFGFRVF